MATLLLTHPDSLRHATPAGHPERADRMRAVLAALAAPHFAPLLRETAPPAAMADITRCHPAAHVEALRQALPACGSVALDPDTHISPASLEAAFAGAGAACRAVDAVIEGGAGNAFAAIRPPGHHAETARPMGFCLLGNVAIAARRALDHHGLQRVAVVDFDVHHGNGTQDLLWDEPRVRFVSSHQMPLWPGTGHPDETGAHGQILNLPLPPGADGAVFRRLWTARGLPFVDAFAPELILLSAGFDGHADDPLAGLALREADFAWITGKLCDLAAAHAGGRLVSVLEGGYDLKALAASVDAHVSVLMERSG